MLQGRLRQTASTFEQVTGLAPKYGGLETLMGSPAYYFGLGDLLRERNELDKAEHSLTQGINLVRGTLTVDAEAATRGYMALARLQQARGESISALEALDRFAQMAGQCGFVPLLLAHEAAVRAQLELAQGKLAAAIRWAKECGLSMRDDNLSYPREREYLSLVRVRIAQRRTEQTGYFPHDVLDLLERLQEDAEAKERMSSVLEILILRALALEAQGDLIGALTTLSRALTLAEPEGYIRLFVDEGIPMAELLHKADTHGQALGYISTLLAAFGK